MFNKKIKLKILLEKKIFSILAARY